MLADRPEGRQEAVGIAGRLEAAHGAVALARRLVGVFGLVVETFMFAMLDTRQHLWCLPSPSAPVGLTHRVLRDPSILVMEPAQNWKCYYVARHTR